MYILCKCGYKIHDNTDRIAYKGHIIADQDWFEFLDLAERAFRSNDSYKLITKMNKGVYQCPQCGCLYVESEGNEFDLFLPGEATRKDCLKSYLGEKWKGCLYAYWNSTPSVWQEHKGMIFPEVNVKYDNLFFDDLEEFKKAYDNLFEELKKKKIIRGASLEIDHKKVHRWEDSE